MLPHQIFGPMTNAILSIQILSTWKNTNQSVNFIQIRTFCAKFIISNPTQFSKYQYFSQMRIWTTQKIQLAVSKISTNVQKSQLQSPSANTDWISTQWKCCSKCWKDANIYKLWSKYRIFLSFLRFFISQASKQRSHNLNFSKVDIIFGWW